MNWHDGLILIWGIAWLWVQVLENLH